MRTLACWATSSLSDLFRTCTTPELVTWKLYPLELHTQASATDTVAVARKATVMIAKEMIRNVFINYSAAN